MLFQCLLSSRKGGVNEACGGHTGDSFSSQGQAGVCGGAGTQLPVLGAGPALLWLPDLRLQFEFAFLTSVYMCGGQYSAFCCAAASCSGEHHFWLSQVSLLCSVEEKVSSSFSVSWLAVFPGSLIQFLFMWLCPPKVQTEHLENRMLLSCCVPLFVLDSSSF